MHDNNRNIILILCWKAKESGSSEKKKRRNEMKLVVGTMLFYSDMKIFPCHTRSFFFSEGEESVKHI